MHQNAHGLDLPVLLVSLFDRHDFVNPYQVGIDVIEQGIFQRYVHTPTGFAGMEFLDIPRRIRMFREPFDMFADHPAIFLGEFPDELFYTLFDVDPHITSVQSPSSFLASSHGMKLPFASISSRSRSSIRF